MRWSENLIGPAAAITDAAAILQNSPVKLVLVVDAERRLLGTVSDGDIRRAILRGMRMDAPLREIMNTAPKVSHLNDDPQDIVALMKQQVIRYLPVIDPDGRVVSIDSLGETVETRNRRRDNIVVLLAGGAGKRLMPLTRNRPKPLLPVGEKPILQIILEQFIGYGFHRFYISVNYLAEQVIAHFGDGARWNVSIDYLTEDKPLGTAGPLAQLPEPPQQPVLVMNGDLLTRVNFEHMLDFHFEHDALATVGVRHYDVQVPFGAVEIEGSRITGLTEKPVYNFFVNAGVYVVSPEFIRAMPADTYADMPDQLNLHLGGEARILAFPIHEYWLDIGRKDDFDRAHADFPGAFP